MFLLVLVGFAKWFGPLPFLWPHRLNLQQLGESMELWSFRAGGVSGIDDDCGIAPHEATHAAGVGGVSKLRCGRRTCARSDDTRTAARFSYTFFYLIALVAFFVVGILRIIVNPNGVRRGLDAAGCGVSGTRAGTTAEGCYFFCSNGAC